MQDGFAPGSQERGQGAVEFALALVVFLFLVMGVVDFSRALFAQEAVQQAATEGARTAAIRQCRDAGVTYPPTGAPTNTSSIDYAVYQASAGLEWTQVSAVSASYESGTATIGRQVTVTVNYAFNVITPIVGEIIEGGLGANPTLTGTATSTVEQATGCP
ncbi:MAG: pilus assembly protein [Chloroflexi bacterium]|nr:pilus assembly protein [Chloroflexota bacterium]